jgi:hypothetical protein
MIFPILSLLIVISAFLILIGFIQYIATDDKKESGLKLIFYGIIGLIIGFGSCFAMIYN